MIKRAVKVCYFKGGGGNSEKYRIFIIYFLALNYDAIEALFGAIGVSRYAQFDSNRCNAKSNAFWLI